MSTSTQPAEGNHQVVKGAPARSRGAWREGGPGRLPRALFLAALAGFGLAAVERVAAAAIVQAPEPAVPAAARCPEGTSLESLLPPGHPPVPGLHGGVPQLPPGHPPVGLVPATPLFPQDAPRTL